MRLGKLIFRPHPILRQIAGRLFAPPESHDVPQPDGSTVTVMTQGWLRTRVGVHSAVAAALAILTIIHLPINVDVEKVTDVIFQLLTIIEVIQATRGQTQVRTVN